MKVSIKLDTRKAKDIGVYPIKFAVSHNQKTAYISTPYSCKVADWNSRTEQVRSSYPMAKQVNEWLKGRLYDYKQRLMALSPTLSVAEVRDRLMAAYEVEHTFHSVFEEHMQRYNGKTLAAYQYALDKINSFSRKCEWCDINYSWLMNFSDWMKNEGLSTDTISLVLRSLRAVCNYALKCGYIQSYPFLRFTIPSSPSSQRRKKTMALSAEQLRGLFSMDLSQYEGMQWARDVLWVSFILGGMNLIDLYRLKSLGEDCIVEYVREKIKRFEPESVHLDVSGLDDDDLNRLQSLSIGRYMIDHRGKDYEAFYNTHKKALQRLSRLVGYNVSLYSVRYSWATIAAKIGVSVSVINRVQAHTDGGNTSEKYYINFDWSQANDAIVKVAAYIKKGDSV